MKPSYGFPALVVVGIAWSIACSSANLTPTGDAGADSAPACIADHEECKDKFDCCSANCVPQGATAFCQHGAAFCTSHGEACTDAMQCCSRICTSGVCVPPPDTGIPLPPGGGSGGGTSAGDPCGGANATCRVSSDCCKGNCSNGHCP